MAVYGLLFTRNCVRSYFGRSCFRNLGSPSLWIQATSSVFGSTRQSTIHEEIELDLALLLLLY